MKTGNLLQTIKIKVNVTTKLSLVTLLFLFLLVKNGNAQQCLAGGCTNFVNQYPSGTFSTTSSTWSVVNGSNAMNAGNYTLFSVTMGNTYQWSYCEIYGGVSTAWDAQLTLFNNTNLTTPLCFSTDVCGTNGNAPYIGWVATFTGTARLLTTAYNGGGCQTYWVPYNRLVWRQSASAGACANVTPYQPSGWDNKIVLSTVTGTNTSATTFLNNQIIYIDWAVINNGTCNISQTFYTKLYLDGVLQNTYSTAGLASNFYTYLSDLTIGPLAAGSHTFQIVTDANSNVTESNESDNSYSRTITVTTGVCANVTSYQPSGWDNNIVLSTVTGTNTSATTFLNNQIIYIDWAVINNGTCNISQTFYTKLYLDGVLQNTYSTAGLASNFYTYLSDLTIGPLAAGSHTFQIVTDANSNVTESNENDNSYSRIITVTSALPDLIITTASASPSTITAGNTSTITYTRKNQGNSTAGSGYTSIWLDANNNGVFDGSPTDIWLADQSNSSLPQGQTSTQSITVTVPLNVSGNKNIIVGCDGTNTVSESNEGNNNYFIPITVVAPFPDLIVLSATITPSNINAGSNATVSFAIKNQGLTTALGNTVSFWLSQNLIFDGSPTDYWLTDISVPSISAGQIYSNSVTITIPAWAVNPQYIMIGADATGIISESNESNNQSFFSINIIQSFPDLIIQSGNFTALSTYPNTAGPSLIRGIQYSLTGNIKNQGSLNAASSVISFHLSSNSTFESGIDPWLNDISVGTLPANTTQSYSDNITIPLSTPPGKYWIIASADGASGINESNETNNDFAVPIYVSIEDTYPFSTATCSTTSPLGFDVRTCTDYVAYKVNEFMGISMSIPIPDGEYYQFWNWMNYPNPLSDAMHWHIALDQGNGQNFYYIIDGNPTPNSIAQWTSSDANMDNHVAWVNSVNTDGTITITEYNVNPCYFGTRTRPANYFARFIHIEQGMQGSFTPWPLINTSSITDAMCGNSGSISVSISQGYAPHMFEWSGPNGFTSNSQNISGLAAGTYTLVVSEPNSNPFWGKIVSGAASATFTVNQSSLIAPVTLPISNLGSCTATLNWSPVNGASSYKVKSRITGTTTWSTTINVGQNTSYTFNSLAPSTQYDLAVASSCSGSTSTFKISKTTTTSCSTPVNIQVSNVTATSAQISWTALCGTNNFKIRYRTVGNLLWSYKTVSVTTGTLTNLSPGTDYEFRVHSICSSSNSALTALGTFTTTAMKFESNNNQIITKKEISNFKVYPNPTIGKFSFEFFSGMNYTDVQIEILNSLGQSIFQNSISITEGENNKEFDLSKFPSGIYFLNLNIGEEMYRQKIIKE